MQLTANEKYIPLNFEANPYESKLMPGVLVSAFFHFEIKAVPTNSY